MVDAPHRIPASFPAARVSSVVLVPAHAPDVVPAIGRVAEVALLDLGVLLPGDNLRHHAEVLHVVARRSLVALRAVGRARRGVAVAGDGPRGHAVAGRAVLPE